MSLQRGRKGNKVVPFTPRHHIVDNISAPAHLPPEERQLFDQIATDYDIRGHTAAAVLEVAMIAHMRSRLAREQIKKDGMMIKTQQGGQRHHPLINVEHTAHVRMVAALRRLGATIDDG
jgi:P27 family predicted phage terminase small subunit